MTTKKYISSLAPIILITLVMVVCAQFAVGKDTTTRYVIDMYGHSLAINVHHELENFQIDNGDKQEIINKTKQLLLSKEVDFFVKELNTQAEFLHLDDMAYLLMLNKSVNSVLKLATDESKTALKYAVLAKKNLDVFLGYSNASLTLYGRTNFLVDNCIFIEEGNKKYFDLSFSQRKLPQPEVKIMSISASKPLPLVMNMINPPALNAKVVKRNIPFEYDGYVYFFKTQVNLSLVEYYRDLPTIDINTVYLNYGFSDMATQSLIADLKRATSGMKTHQAIDFMLKFVQNAFEYKNDELVYGEEKFSFPEETLMNPFSDCEDKAMLFAVLVNKVLGLKSVGLFYKDAKHINIAVETWKKEVKGNFSFNNQNYIVCEPSGKGFGIGESATTVSYANLIDW
jgi:hypothetical protein